jgi:putative alpha-1,2-mannosidase
MSNRIPSSLSWLIDKRARLAGDIQRTKKALLKVQHLVHKQKELEAALEAVDKSLKLHDIQVDVANIKPIYSHQLSKLKFQHGDINQLILIYLRAQQNHNSISTLEIADHIHSKHQELGAITLSRRQFMTRVRQSLNRLRRLGLTCSPSAVPL